MKFSHNYLAILIGCIISLNLTATNLRSPTGSDTNRISSQGQLDELVVSEFQRVTADYWDRHKKAEKDIETLSGGCWYATHYFSQLKHHSDKNTSALTRLKFLRERGLLSRPYYAESKKNQMHSLVVQKDVQKIGNQEKIDYHLRLRRGAKASDALADLRSPNLITFIDCNMAIQIAYYESLLKIFGQTTFDKLFSNHEMPFLHAITSSTMLGAFTSKSPKSLHALKPSPSYTGEHFYLLNHHLYTDKHLLGNAAGFNLLSFSIGGNIPKFLGFGLDPDGITIEELKERQIDEFNRVPFRLEMVPKGQWNQFLSKHPSPPLVNALKDKAIKSLDDVEIFYRVLREIGYKENEIKGLAQFCINSKRQLIGEFYVSHRLDWNKLVNHLK